MSDKTALKILMVDDEPLVLAGYRRNVGRSFNLTCAEGGAAGLEAIESSGPFAVVITDMRMPQISGLEFIAAARTMSRDSVFMMLTGNADQQTAVSAINQGQIFRFLNKPCAPEMLEGSIKAAIRQYELLTAERVLLRETLAGSIKFMMEALDLSNPELFAFQALVRQILLLTSTGIGIRNDWQLPIAGSLNLIGLLTFPDLSPKNGLSDERLIEIATVSSRLLSHIPRIEMVVAMIRRQREAATLLPLDLQALAPEAYETLGAQLLRFSVDLAREERRLNNRASAARHLQQSEKYDSRLTGVFTAKASSAEAIALHLQKLTVFDLVPGMIMGEDVRREDGTLLISRGLPLSKLSIASLQNAADRGMIGKPVTIQVEDSVVIACA
jgi:CheY-like chemotaxis protein